VPRLRHAASAPAFQTSALIRALSLALTRGIAAGMGMRCHPSIIRGEATHPLMPEN
jgi:hypothetical protein